MSFIQNDQQLFELFTACCYLRAACSSSWGRLGTMSAGAAREPSGATQWSSRGLLEDIMIFEGRVFSEGPLGRVWGPGPSGGVSRRSMGNVWVCWVFFLDALVQVA